MDTSVPQRNGMVPTIWVCGLIIAAGVMVCWNYLVFTKSKMADKDYLPNIQALEKDLTLLNPKGEEVRLHSLDGKVWVMAYVYTRCPAGCLGIVEYMKQLEEKFGKNPDFRLVAITLDPEKDTPEWLDQWTKERGLVYDNWLFLTGDSKQIHSYVGNNFKLYLKPRTDPAAIAAMGAWEHEFKLVLVDRRLMIRYYYDVMDVTRGEEQMKKLERDIQTVLDHKDKLPLKNSPN